MLTDSVDLRRSLSIALVGVVLIAATFVLVSFVFGADSDAGVATADIGQAVVNLTAGLIILLAARRAFKPGEGPRQQWGLIGVGVVVFALGDVTLAIYEVGLGLDPYPSLADVFYVGGYFFLAAGVVRAGLAYRSLVPLRNAVIMASVVAVAGVAAIYAFLLGPTILPDTELTTLAKALSAFYPLGDVLLGFAPAVFVLAVVGRLGGGRLAWPWWAVAAGLMLMAVTDTSFSYLDWQGTYQPGSILDYGWMFSYLLIALGAAVAGDVALSAAHHRGRAAEAAEAASA